MDQDRYRRLKRLFTEAGALAGAEREAFLDAECAGDDALRTEVEDLLHTAGASPRVAAAVPGPAAPGRVIGPYELVERIGEGGMGSVWRARQSRPVRREVALKLLRAGLDSPEALARFEAERQALALMDHHCIAKVYDAGATPDGHPYFAMEYVHGSPLTAYCDRHRLTVARRLELLLRVCAGVQHAHQKAVIHRDLKPSNILVTGEGVDAVPKIIDFGVAKAVGARLTDRTMVTHRGALLGTPEYMSPEQADLSAVEVDTRTDVYALGVLLYELLTGTLPHDPARLRAAGYDGVRRILRDEEPPPPSARLESLDASDAAIIAARRHAEPAGLVADVRVDLDWIVMKAMEKEPGRRYESASQLADDLRRHLAHEPVLARPPSTAYRLSKFLRRHRAAAGATGLVASFLLAFGVAMAVQAARVARERDRARAEAERAEAVSGYVLELFEASDPTAEDYDEEEAEVARRMLLRGLERADALAGQPEAQAQLLGGIGLVLLNRGLPDDAYDVLRRAVEARPDAVDHIAQGNLVNLGRAETELGRYEDAEAHLRRAVDLAVRAHAEPHSDVATAKRWLAELLRTRRRLDEAEILLREAADVQRATHGADHVDYASTISSLGHVLRTQGRLDESLALVREAHEIQKRVLGERHSEIATSLTNLAGLLRELGRPDEAEPLYRESIVLFEELYGDRSARTAVAYNNYGVFLRGQGRPAEAAEVLAKAVAIGEATMGPDSPSVAKFLGNLGRAVNGAGDPVAAERHLRRAIAIQAAQGIPDDPSLATFRADLAASLAAQGRAPEAVDQ